MYFVQVNSDAYKTKDQVRVRFQSTNFPGIEKYLIVINKKNRGRRIKLNFYN